MEINQFFISNTPFEIPENGKVTNLGDMKIWTHSNLELSRVQSGSTDFLLLGFWVHPEFPKLSNEAILNHLSSLNELSTEFFDYLNQLVGRFVLIQKSDKNFIILNDARAQRQVFYHFDNESFYCTSSPQLFYKLSKFPFEIPTDKKVILTSRRYKVLDEWFPGDEYLDTYLKRLLPNFYLEITSKQTKRIPYSVAKMDKDKLKSYLKKQIIGAAEACAFRHENILFGVTGGSDSRLILSLNPNLKNTTYFIYDREEKNKIDVEISKQLTKKKGITLKVIQPPPLSVSFLEFYKKQFLHPRVISKTQNYQWLKENFETNKSIVITGYSGEIFRNKVLSVNPYHKKFNTTQDFVDYFHYPKSDYLEKMLEKWLSTAPDYIRGCNHLNLAELFYWEIHVAYSALYAFEQDISGIEMFSPLSNRQMILNLIHNTTAEQRSAPNGIIYQIINETSPEWKGIPYNPRPFHKKIKDEVFKLLPLKVVNLLINR